MVKEVADGGNSGVTMTPPGAVTILPGIFNETVELLMTAHDYFNIMNETEVEELPPVDRLLFSGEMSRITLRLSSIMSWLVVRKAVFDGRMDDSFETREKYRLAFQDTCVHINEQAENALPEHMLYLLEKSHELYMRIKRLDEMVYSGLPPLPMVE